MVLWGPAKALLFVCAGLPSCLCFVCICILWDIGLAVWRHPHIRKSGKQTGEERLLRSSSPLDSASPNVMFFRISFGKCCCSLGKCISAWYRNGFHGGFVARTAGFSRTGVSKVESATCCSYGTKQRVQLICGTRLNMDHFQLEL